MGLPTAFLSRGRPLKGPFYLRLSFLATRKRVHELLKAQLIGNLVLLQLIFNVLLDFLFVLSYRIHEVSPGPEMPIAILVLQICMSVENHETALSFEISHDVGNKDEIFFSFAWHFVFFQISAYKKADNRFGVVRRRMYCFRHSINGNLSNCFSDMFV